jgi:outer membrane scaffolding protein for murein synthesis (MipA/OmpV family)
LAIAAGLSLAAPAVLAQAFDAVRLFGAASGVDRGSAGVAFIAGTEYAGSDERRNLVLPLLDYQWMNGWFAGTSNGVGYEFGKRRDMQYGLRLTFDRGRDADRSSVLRGMGDIDIKPEAGAFFNYFVSPQVFLTSSLRFGAGNNGRGMVVDLGAGYATQLAPQWRMAVGAAASLVNADTMQSYFGVTPAQAAASGHPVYTPGSGLRDVRVNLSLNYLLTRQVTFTTALSVSSLQGGAKDSPLTRKATSPTGVFVIGYAF